MYVLIFFFFLRHVNKKPPPTNVQTENKPEAKEAVNLVQTKLGNITEQRVMPVMPQNIPTTSTNIIISHLPQQVNFIN